MKRTLKIAIPIAAAVIAIAAVGSIMQALFYQESYKPAIELQPEKLKDFELIDQYGNLFRLSSVKGKVILLFFGYTNCPDICPLVLSRYAYLAEKLGPDIDKVAMIFVTVDPDRDTPEVIRIHLERYSDRIIGLSGPREMVEEVWKLYKVKPLYTEKDEQGNYFVTHPAFVFVADKNMVMRLALTPEMDPEEYVKAVRYLLSR